MDERNVSEAWRDTARRRLETLGRTANAVAQALEIEGVKGGRPGDPAVNPLAVWLGRHYGGIVKVSKDGGANFYVKGNNVPYATVELPIGCYYFVNDYDQGAFTALMKDVAKSGLPAA